MNILKKWFKKYKRKRAKEKVVNNFPIPLLVLLYNNGFTNIITEIDILKEICFFLVHKQQFTKDILDYLYSIGVYASYTDIIENNRSYKKVKLIDGKNDLSFFEENILI